MSIYGTSFSRTDDDHADGCAIYVETSPDVFDFSGNPCDCGTRRAPIVYEGSHILPSEDDRRGGGIQLAEIPDFIEREGRVPPFDFLRLDAWNVASTAMFGDEPRILGGYAVVVLDRPLVVGLRDALSAWLDREETA